MKLHTLEQAQFLAISPEEAWAFFSTPRNLAAITPPDMGFRIESGGDEPLHAGQIITYRIRLAPLVEVAWVTVIQSVESGRAFLDEQCFGPFKFWHHRHTFEPVPGGVRIGDCVHYALPFGPLGGLVHAVAVRRRLERIFRYRRNALARWFDG